MWYGQEGQRVQNLNAIFQGQGGLFMSSTYLQMTSICVQTICKVSKICIENWKWSIKQNMYIFVYHLLKMLLN